MARMVIGVVSVLIWAMLMMIQVPEVAAFNWSVGGDSGWIPEFNYTSWTENKTFHMGDVLEFASDTLFNLLEVNKTCYESCDSDTPLFNWATGAERAEVPLNETRDYYFIGSHPLCIGGMKLAVAVESPPSPPPSSSASTVNESPTSLYRGQIVLPAVFAISGVSGIFLGLW